jgi:hypothetical protein
MGSIIKYLFHYLHCSVRILVSDSSMEMMATWTKKVNCAMQERDGEGQQSSLQCSAVLCVWVSFMVSALGDVSHCPHT